MVRESWDREYFCNRWTDDVVRPFLIAERRTDWLEAARSASFLSRQQVAERIPVAKSTYIGFEQNESTVGLATMQTCAEAMGCDFIYAIVPKERTTFGDRIWKLLEPHMNREERTIDAALRSVVRVMFHPRFRREQGWRRNSTDEARLYLKLLKPFRPF